MNDKYLDADYQRAVSEFVSREVRCCASGIVHKLANGYGSTEGEVGELCEKAFELSCPTDDWSEPVIHHVQTLSRADLQSWLEDKGFAVHDNEPEKDLQHAMFLQILEDKCEQQYCEDENLDPYQNEIYEHWIVSKYLADKLAEKGEKIDLDFDGLIIWGRHTSGQAISIDNVICQIYDDMMKA